MKILLIGVTGTIGQAVANELESDNEIIGVSSSQGDIRVDISDSASIKAMYEKVGPIDAVICAAARGILFRQVNKMRRADYQQSLQNKLLGQIDLVLQGLAYVNESGSFTLTSGVLNIEPIITGSAASMVNSAVEGFVTAASIDMPKSQRINVVSPALLTESIDHYGALFPGYETVSAAKVARAYRKSIFAGHNGQIYNVS